jgi:PAS domain S-box-containing protein
LLLLTLITPCALVASQKRVLILNPFERDVAPFDAAVSAFRTTLVRELGEPVDFYEVPLDLARFGAAEGKGPLVAFLEGRITRYPVDLIVPVGWAGVQFAARHRERLFPDTPVLAVGSQPRLVPPGFLQSNATLVTQRVDLPGMVEDILQMQPQSANIAIVFGSSALENFWVNECRREFQPFTNRVRFTWLNGLSLEQVLERCAALPPRSFILHGLFVVGADGVPCGKNEAIRRLHEIANAPLFAYYASEFGLGSVGGRLYQDSEVGTQGAHIAIRILRGESPKIIPPRVLEAATPVYDWRELQRWGISETRLPAGSIIQFRQQGFWELYRWPIAGMLLICLLQIALIIGLLVSRANRRREEAMATLIADISSKFVNLLPGDVDREIEDALRRFCEPLGIDLAVLWQWSGEAPDAIIPTHTYCAKQGLRLSPMRQDQYPWAVQQVMAGRTFAISSLGEYPAEAAVDRDTCQQIGIKAGVCLPLSVGGEPPIGALGLNALRTERDWPDTLVRRLQLVAQIFANALARKRADQTLYKSEERFRLLIEQAPEAILVQDFEQGRFVLVNSQAERLFGCSREELLASSPQRFYVPRQPDGQPIAETVRAHSEQALRGETVIFERTICNAIGQRLDCEVRLTRLPAGDRKLVRASFIDITGRKQAEAALHDLSGRLIHAHEEERAWLARELHDDVTQRLARLAIDAGRVQGGADGTSAAETISSIRDGLVRLSEDIHSLSYRLHPSLLEDLGLGEALKAECERFSRQESIAAALSIRELPAFIPPETALCLFRVAQEALQNVSRHAQARAIEVSMRAVDDGLQLAVLDDGIGFEPAAPRGRRSLGLAGMRERLHLLGGELEIESTPGKGTTVLAWVPLQKGQS